MARLIRKAGDIPARTLWGKIQDVALMDVAVLAKGGVPKRTIEDVEQLLLEADFGVATTMRLVSELERQASRGFARGADGFRDALLAGIEAALRSGRSDPRLVLADAPPTVILVIGVNGAGKTTFIGKLAAQLAREQNEKVFLGAADTFRAGAADQLKVWAERAGADFVGARAGSDPASVAYDAVDTGITRGAGTVIIDTAGRLHTSDSLLEELRKIHRVIGKRLPGAPHETLLVLDGTIGQNAIAQATTFAAAIPVTGIVVTKLDGTARGGIVVAVHEALNVPVKFVGTGEQIGDLAVFDPAAFAREVLGE